MAWKEYIELHQTLANQLIHAVAIVMGWGMVGFFGFLWGHGQVSAVVGVLLAFPTALGIAASGHVLEGNRPAAFKRGFRTVLPSVVHAHRMFFLLALGGFRRAVR